MRVKILERKSHPIILITSTCPFPAHILRVTEKIWSGFVRLRSSYYEPLFLEKI